MLMLVILLPVMSRRRGHYDYNSKPRNWRKDRTRDRWKVFIMLVIGLSIAGYIVYQAIIK